MGKALSCELSCPCDRSCSFITCVFQLSSFTLHSMPDVWKDPIPSLISVFQDEQSPLDVSLKMMNVYLNPIALRKFKIVYNFGLSECNGVKNSNCCERYM